VGEGPGGCAGPLVVRGYDGTMNSRTRAPSAMPPGPPLPKSVQTPLQWLARPWWMAAVRRRYGNVFTLRDQISDTGDLVVLADPADVKTVFTGSPEVFHAGEGNAVLGPLVGPHSVLLLDEDEHLRERKLQLPAFHGERIAQSIGLMREATEREVGTWPLGTPFRLLSRTQALTLDIIVRVVLGVDDARRADPLKHALRTVLEIRTPHLLMWLHPGLARIGPWKRLRQDIARADALLYAEIAHRRAAGGLQDRPDVLSMLLLAHAAAGDDVDDAWVRDELMTLLVAGHETTATGLAWAFERLLRHPQALERVRAGLDDPRDPYVDAVVKETLRVRPVIYNVARVLAQPATVAGYDLPAGTVVLPSIGLLHGDDAHFSQAAAFRPERWLDGGPEPYTWIPFGGGVRRCLGATFALTEMAVVIRTVLQQVDLRAADPAPERTKVHHITLIPAKGASVVVERRRRPTGRGERRAGAPAPALAT
jgi:cytochrome P450 family 135